jgi:serine/threonine-protein kinase
MLGEKIKQYQIIELLGEGGMGTVYRAKDTILQREVAIKMIHKHLQDQDVLSARFKNEALLSARISHPNVTTLFQFLEDGPTAYLIMEYVNGENLEKILRQHGSLSAPIVLQILVQLLEGLQHAHQKGIVHRDIKPGNMMLSSDGYVKLMDFGIARIEESNRLTRVNHVMGTTAYMAPELLSGAKPSIASDLYAVGIVGCELLTGTTPFDQISDASMIHQILHKSPSIASKTNSSTEKNLIRILKKLLAKNPNKRFAAADDVLVELRTIGGQYTRIKIQADHAISELAASPIRSLAEFAKRIITGFEKAYLNRSQKFNQTLEGKIIIISLILACIIMISAMLSGERAEKPATVGTTDENYLSNSIVPNLLQEGQITRPEYLNAMPENSVNDSLQDHLPDHRPTLPNEEITEKTPQDVDKKAPPLNAIRKKDEEKINENKNRESKKELTSVKDPLLTKDSSSNPKNELSTSPEETAPAPEKNNVDTRGKTISVTIPEQLITAVFTTPVSSDRHQKNDIIYLQNQSRVITQGHVVINTGARIKAVIKEAYSSKERAKAYLAIEFLAVEAANGEWLEVQYPLYSDKDKNEVVFRNGTTIQKMKLKSQSIQLQIAH